MRKQPFLTIEIMKRLFSIEYIKNQPVILRKKEFYDVKEVAYLISPEWKAYDLMFFLRNVQIIRSNGLPYKHFSKYGVIGGRKLGTNDYETIFTEKGVAYVRETYFNGPMAKIIKLSGYFS